MPRQLAIFSCTPLFPTLVNFQIWVCMTIQMGLTFHSSQDHQTATTTKHIFQSDGFLFMLFSNNPRWLQYLLELNSCLFSSFPLDCQVIENEMVCFKITMVKPRAPWRRSTRKLKPILKAGETQFAWLFMRVELVNLPKFSKSREYGFAMFCPRLEVHLAK